jgi:Leucine-rich repeat (LRR) protein
LSLAGNCLTELPPSIGKLTQLKRLGLAGNRLTSLPEEIGNLTQLEVSQTYTGPACPLL